MTVARSYSDDEMAQLYDRAEGMPFAGGCYTMTAEDALCLASGLVVLDRGSGKFRRGSSDPSIEMAIINEAYRVQNSRVQELLSSRLPWSSSRLP